MFRLHPGAHDLFNNRDPNLQISHILLRVAQEIYFLTGARIHTLAGYECGDGTKQVTA